MEGMKGVLQIHWEDAEHRVPARIGAKRLWEAGFARPPERVTRAT